MNNLKKQRCHVDISLYLLQGLIKKDLKGIWLSLNAFLGILYSWTFNTDILAGLREKNYFY